MDGGGTDLMEWMVHIHVQLDRKLRAPGLYVNTESEYGPITRAYHEF